MFLIEPCCAPKNLLALRHKLGNDGTCLFHGHGDLSLAELLPALLSRYSKTDITIVAPRLPDAATEVIKLIMERQWTAADGKGKVDNVGHLTIFTDLRKTKSPIASAWVKANPYGDRLTLHSVQQNDTAIILPDIALQGPINLVYGGHFTALATKRMQTINVLKTEYGKLCP